MRLTYERLSLCRNHRCVFRRQRSLRAFLRKVVGGRDGNNHRGHHRTVAVCLSFCRDDPSRKVLTLTCKLQIGFNLLSTSLRWP
jgi:hypothetical protein